MASIKQVIQKLNRPQRAAYLFIAPALILLFVFTIVPLLSTLVISVLNMDVFLKVSGFAGFGHFKRYGKMIDSGMPFAIRFILLPSKFLFR